jgi:hypothetical protein
LRREIIDEDVGWDLGFAVFFECDFIAMIDDMLVDI